MLREQSSSKRATIVIGVGRGNTEKEKEGKNLGANDIPQVWPTATLASLAEWARVPGSKFLPSRLWYGMDTYTH